MRQASRYCAMTLGVLLLLTGGARALAQPAPQPYGQPELDQMLAHVALYPDVLLSQILMAATYPLEVVEAARWLRRNPGLQGEAAVEAAVAQGWAPSVAALVAFPEVLFRMDEHLEWTQALGEAFMVQEAQVMDTIQQLRRRAWAAGNLAAVEHIAVRHEHEVIYIEPARPQVVHVPYYQPLWVYGYWWYPAWPPYYWPPMRWSHGYWSPVAFYPATGFYWGSGVHLSVGFFFSRVDWRQRHVVYVHAPVYRPRYRPAVTVVQPGYRGTIKPGQRWQHDPLHRRGVAWRAPGLQQRYPAHAASRPATAAPTRERGRPAADSRWQGGQPATPRWSAEAGRSQSGPGVQRSGTTGRETVRAPDAQRSAPVRREATPAPRGLADRGDASPVLRPQVQPRQPAAGWSGESRRNPDARPQIAPREPAAAGWTGESRRAPDAQRSAPVRREARTGSAPRQPAAGEAPGPRFGPGSDAGAGRDVRGPGRQPAMPRGGPPGGRR